MSVWCEQQNDYYIIYYIIPALAFFQYILYTSGHVTLSCSFTKQNWEKLIFIYIYDIICMPILVANIPLV